MLSGGGVILKALTVAALATLCLGFGINSADAQEVNDNISANSHPEFISGSPYSASDVMFRHSEALAEEFPNSTSMRHSEGDSPKNLISTDPSHSFRMTGNGVTTGFAAEIDPEHIGDTLVGTNHVTYSSTDEAGTSTGHVDVTNPDGSTQTIYYTYTMPADYEVTNERINKTVTQDNVSNKLFQGISSQNTYGGAINNNSNNSNIDINSDFINNTLNGVNYHRGGAISNTSVLQNIYGDFIRNNTHGINSVAQGSAIFNSKNIENIIGDFISNVSTSEKSYAAGAAIYNGSGVIKDVKGNFIGNKLISHMDYTQGGAIYNESGQIGNIEGVFISNYIHSEKQGYGAAIRSLGKISSVNAIFIDNAIYAKTRARGGAIYSQGAIGIKDDEGNLTGGIVNSNFIGNYAKSESGTAQGGAIYTTKDLNIIADNGSSTFKDNYVQIGDGEKQYEAIYVDNANATLTFDAKNNGKFVIDDYTNGAEGYKIKFTGDDTGTVNYNNTFKGSPNLTIENTNFNWNLVNNNIYNVNLSSFTMNSNIDFKADVDLAKETMDRITAGSYTIADGAKLTVSGMNLLNDAEKDSTKIFFAEESLANSVDTTVKTASYSPIYKYDVNYLVDEDNKGYFTFARSASGGGSDGYNPSVLASPVATQAAAQVTMENTFNYSFSNSETFMQMPNSQRTALRNRNKYAIAENELPDGSNPLYQVQDTSSAWFKPYASFENVPLKNGPKVNVISYGALAGYDTDLKEMKRGWARAWTGFVGYNGANLNYNGVTTTQNGGILGGTLTMYKGNFFNATTLSAGATVGENSTMYGHDTTTSLLAGIGNKTGYNLEFSEGKFIIQPSLFLGYTFVKTFDYTNAAGVRIDSDPAHTMQISPGLKFIGNLKHGWQPYIGVNMVWNVLNNSHVKANSVTLPQMSVKPYIQYGIGLQKTVKDNFVAYGQAMVQNGGRNGISLTAGFRWAIGKNHKPIEKVQNNPSDKKVIKSATENKNQKIANNINPKMSKVQEFFAKMNGEPTKQSAITTSKAVISKI